MIHPVPGSTAQPNTTSPASRVSASSRAPAQSTLSTLVSYSTAPVRGVWYLVSTIFSGIGRFILKGLINIGSWFRSAPPAVPLREKSPLKPLVNKRLMDLCRHMLKNSPEHFAVERMQGRPPLDDLRIKLFAQDDTNKEITKIVKKWRSISKVFPVDDGKIIMDEIDVEFMRYELGEIRDLGTPKQETAIDRLLGRVRAVESPPFLGFVTCLTLERGGSAERIRSSIDAGLYELWEASRPTPRRGGAALSPQDKVGRYFSLLKAAEEVKDGFDQNTRVTVDVIREAREVIQSEQSAIF